MKKFSILMKKFSILLILTMLCNIVSAMTVSADTIQKDLYVFDDFEASTLGGAWSATNKATVRKAAGGAGGSEGCLAVTISDPDNVRAGYFTFYFEKGVSYDMSFWVKLMDDNIDISKLAAENTRYSAIKVMDPNNTSNSVITNTAVIPNSQWQYASAFYTHTLTSGTYQVQLLSLRSKLTPTIFPDETFYDYTSYFDDVTVKKVASEDLAGISTFNGNVSGWATGSPSKLEWSSEKGYDGKSGCALLTEAAAQNGWRCAVTSAANYTFEQGKTYELGAWVKLNTDISPTKVISFYFNQLALYCNTTVKAKYGEWVYASYEFIPTAEQSGKATQLWIFTQKDGFKSFNTEIQAYFDNIMCREKVEREPASVEAKNVTVSGEAYLNEVLSFSYEYTGVNAEKQSVYKLMVSDTGEDNSFVCIKNGTVTADTPVEYTLTSKLKDKYIKMEIIPFDMENDIGERVYSEVLNIKSRYDYENIYGGSMEAGEILNAQTAFENNSQSDIDIVVLLALYNSKNTVIGMDYKTMTVTAGNREIFYNEVKAEDGAVKAKVFIINSASVDDLSMLPMCKSIEYAQ